MVNIVNSHRGCTLPLIFVSLLLFNSCRAITENKNDDILALLIKKPNQLTFLKCTAGSGQLVLEAKYRLSGMDAHTIEKLLHNKYGMGKLKFACCGWEAYPSGKLEITDEFNTMYAKRYEYNHISISMYSQETLIHDRRQWHKIPYFYVVVKVLNI